MGVVQCLKGGLVEKSFSCSSAVVALVVRALWMCRRGGGASLVQVWA